MSNRASPLGSLAVLTALAVASCGDSTAPRVPTTVELDRLSLALEVGDTVRVGARVLDQNGQAFAAGSDEALVTWSSTSVAVATVEDGLVTGVRPGATTIRARANGIEPADLSVEVSARTHTGEINFDYSGQRSGTFSLSSTFQFLPTGPTAESWVVTFHDADFGTQDVFAWQQRGDGLVDLAWFWVEGAVAQPLTRNADDGVLLLAYNPASDRAEAQYRLTGGSVSFTSATTHQRGGTFTLSLVEVVAGEPGAGTIEVANGTFSAPVVASSLILGAPAAGAAEGWTSGPPPALDLAPLAARLKGR